MDIDLRAGKYDFANVKSFTSASLSITTSGMVKCSQARWNLAIESLPARRLGSVALLFVKPCGGIVSCKTEVG